MLNSSTDYERQFRSKAHYRTIVIWMAVATIIGAGLRLYQLEEGSFWLDELFTIIGSSQLSEMHYSKRLGYVPTVIGLTLAGVDVGQITRDTASWQAMGITEGVARLPTTVLGILTIPILGLASARLFGGRTAILIALLLAIAPWHIYWSQAARFYIPQFLFYTLGLILYFTATRHRSPQQFAAAMACMVLAFLSQPTALIMLGVFAIDWIVAQWRRQPLAMGAAEWIMGVVAVSVCILVLSYDVFVAPERWTHFVVDDARHQSPFRLLFGAAYMIGPGIVVFAGLTALGMWKRQIRLAVFLLAAGLVPIVLFAIFSAWAFVGLRYSFIALYGWLGLAAIGLELIQRTTQRRLGAAMAWSPAFVLLAGLGMSNYIYFRSDGNFHARWRDAANYVQANRTPGERIAASDPLTAAYYMQELVEELPTSHQALQELDEVTWFIVEVTGTRQSTSRHWLFHETTLKDAYPMRIIHGTSIMQVYKHDPNTQCVR